MEGVAPARATAPRGGRGRRGGRGVRHRREDILDLSPRPGREGGPDAASGAGHREETKLRILLTGPGGLGLAILDELARAGATGVALSRRGAAPLPPGWESVRADLTEPGTLRGVCAGCDVVLHLAAVTHSNRPGEYDRVNVGGTRHLLDEARAAGVPHLVHVSSRAIDPRGGAYSRSKAAAEALVRGSGLPWTILRPAEVYGAGREGLAKVIDRARAGRWIPCVGDGRWRLSPVYLDDLVAGVLAAVRRAPEGRLYSLVGPEEISFRELVERLGAFFGTRPPIVHLPAWALRGAARALALSGWRHPPLFADQVDRLLAPKLHDLEPAATDLDYRPRPLEQGLAALTRHP